MKLYEYALITLLKKKQELKHVHNNLSEYCSGNLLIEQQDQIAKNIAEIDEGINALLGLPQEEREMQTNIQLERFIKIAEEVASKLKILCKDGEQ